MNPALAARAILFAAWPVEMTNWQRPLIDAFSNATSSATLPILKDGRHSKVTASMGCFRRKLRKHWQISALALLLGAAYLLIREL